MKSRALLLCALMFTFGCPRKEQPRENEDHDASAKEHADVVTLKPAALESAGIKTGKVEHRPLSTGLTAPARIAFTQTGVARVAARVQGRLVSIDVQLGQKVKKGQVLGVVESAALGQARADYLAAHTKSRVAEGNFRREQELVTKGISSVREMREAETNFATAQAEMNAAEGRLHALGLSDGDIKALKADEHYSSRSPERSAIDGTVVEIAGTLGQSVEPAAPLFTVGDLSTLWVLLDVYEAQLSMVSVGQPVNVTVNALPDKRYAGRVDYIGDIVDERSRAVPVRVVILNPEGLLKPGMYANAEIGTAGADAGTDESRRLIVPRDAVQKLGVDHVVFVPVAPGQFKPVKVAVGVSSAKEIEITSGLEPGDTVVTSGAFILKSELSKDSMGEGD